MFAAASESVALLNLGFAREEIKSLAPGHCLTIVGGKIEIRKFTESARSAHCFFEWVYFANVASTLDDRGVYIVRKNLGEELAQLEIEKRLCNFSKEDTIVVPVPDTSKAAADAMAFRLGLPSMEGLIRNRYAGRTFIMNSQESRMAQARIKYTPLREILEGKKVILVEDSIVRSTTMQSLVSRIRSEGKAREIHVRVACPPIIAPCFYGIDMSSIRQLFAPRFYKAHEELTPEIQERMARDIGVDSLMYLPIAAIARSIGMSPGQLCQACITADYPTPAGAELYQLDVARAAQSPGADANHRAFDSVGTRI
jgi:amidophosphoribosyltransferase